MAKKLYLPLKKLLNVNWSAFLFILMFFILKNLIFYSKVIQMNIHSQDHMYE